MKTSRIEIQFPVDVDFPAGFEQALDALINMVCEKYEEDNPTMTMWPAGYGGKPKGNWMFPESEKDMDFDLSILCIDVAVREAYEKEIKRRNRA